ncbi:sensor histidine kinase [Streptomyces armeniacus]|uniref:sensor histidine kinase n=1 Tax=Streptomyces armeniacus TaxID=83291 RepID=UPI001AD84250|nr:hypothetical protein [Streptomyces armeniacus]
MAAGTPAATRTPHAPGQSELALNSAFERYSVLVRTCVVGATGLFAIFTVPPDRILQMSITMAMVFMWCAVRLFWLHLRPPVRYILALELGVLPVLGLSQGWTGTETVDSWVLAIASITALTYQVEWTTRPFLALLLAIVSLSSYIGGLALVAPSEEISTAFTLSGRIFGECLMWRAIYMLTRRQARSADEMMRKAAESRRAALVGESRRQAEREYFATLHDTASATLLTVSMGAPGYDRDQLARRARRDLAALTDAREGGSRDVDLAALLATLTDQHTVRLGLDLGGPLVLPAKAGLAIFRGVREGLINIERHAGVYEAVLSARRDEPGRYVVELRDAGRGFDTGRIPAQRRGLSSSIMGRMAAVGGSASVTSGIGEGTTVRWVWPDEPA